MTKRSLILLLAFASSAAALHGQGQAPQPQQPPITFRAEINYIEVDARVLDQQGKFITGLKPEDFAIFEDGKPQKVMAFSMVNIPLERVERPLFASRPVEPDVRNNMQAADGRIYVIMLDDLHTAPLRSQRVKLAARQFIERYVGANDLAAVVHTSGRSNAGQEFTTSQSRLLRAVDQFMGRKLTSSTMNMIGDVQRRSGTLSASDPAADLDDKERGFQARNTLDSLRNVAQYLGNIRGRRKAVVMFGEGIDYNINEMFSDQITEAQTVIDATREMLAAATRANVAIYAVDPRGLGAEFDELSSIQSFPDDTTLGLGHVVDLQRGAAVAGQPARDGRRDRRLCRRQQEQFQRRLPAHRRRQQLVLRDGLLLDQRSSRRPVPENRSAAAGQAGTDACARAKVTWRRVARRRRPRRRPRTARRRSCATRWKALCR